LVGVTVYSHPTNAWVLTNVFPGVPVRQAVEPGRFVLINEFPEPAGQQRILRGESLRGEHSRGGQEGGGSRRWCHVPDQTSNRNGG
jgi:hypothetical protein